VEGEDDDDVRRSASHARLQRDRELDEHDLSKIAEDVTKRYKQSAPTRYTGDMNEIPQRLLMPSVHDANLWQVRVKVRNLISLDDAYILNIFIAWQRA
jgi:transcription elongation factor SPT5